MRYFCTPCLLTQLVFPVALAVGVGEERFVSLDKVSLVTSTHTGPEKGNLTEVPWNRPSDLVRRLYTGSMGGATTEGAVEVHETEVGRKGVAYF